MPPLSPILDAFLNDNQSPEQIADTHKITVREVLDLLCSEEATAIFRRLAQVERQRQAVLGARARSKALATLDYLTLFDRHAKHADCDIRRRVSEVILRQTRPEKKSLKHDGRAPSPPGARQLPDLARLRAARIAAEQSTHAASGCSDRAINRSAHPLRTFQASALPPDPSPLFRSLPQHAARRFSLPFFPQPHKAAGPTCMNSASSGEPSHRVGLPKPIAPDGS